PGMFRIVGEQSKVVVARSASDLISTYHRIARLNQDMVIQELIPGEDDRHFQVCLYCDRNGDPRGMFAARRLRLFPLHFGVGSFVETFYDPTLVELAVQIA